jgi:hypothetical protein
MTRILIAISGVLGVVLPNVGNWGLPVAAQATITSVGGALLVGLAILEHPTTKQAVTKGS